MPNLSRIPSTLAPARHESARRRRSADAGCDDEFVTRWSSRAFSSEPLTQELLDSLFEAARWAPSASNAQPAFFLYADHAADLATYRALIKDNNRRWADQAPVLAFVFARRSHEGAALRTAAFDTGAAWMSLALQARKLDLVVRAMGGIHRDEVCLALGVPADQFDVICGLAIGHPGDPQDLPPDLRIRELPNSRRPLREVAVRGHYPGPA
jgi:nitroreductase